MKKILLRLITFVLLGSSLAYAGPYLDSAHGNTSYGVNRSRTADFGYTQGSCAHCHEQHASVEGQALASPAPYHFGLFYDDLAAYATLCTTCHYQSSTYQQVTNYPYAKTFGGSPNTWYGDIYTQFSSSNSLPAACGSRHHLGRIQYVIKSNAFGWGFNDDPNPCVACHNPHADQQNHPVVIDGEGKLNTAIRRPSHYDSTNSQDILWGDDANERMSSYASSVGGYYKAPYYTAGATFEPANNSTSDGSNLPDYVTFCMDCHQSAQYDPDRGVSVKAIVWDYSHGSYPDIHGAAPANTLDASAIGCLAAEGSLKAPYNTYEPNQSNYVLSCLDCHEPHGNYRRLHLIRLRINGEAVGVDASPCDANADYTGICIKCHNMDHETGFCKGCHGNGITDVFHGSVFECSYGVGDCVVGQPDTCPRSF